MFNLNHLSTKACHAWRRSLTLFVLTVGLALSGAAQAAPEENRPGVAAPALASFLAADGTLHLPPGFRGSLDARGWALVSGEDEAPRFVPLNPAEDRGAGSAESVIPGESAGSHAPRVAGSQTPRSPAGDERWADNFAPNGVSENVYALAVDGSGSVYVGGYFAVASAITVNRVARWNESGWSSLGYGLNDGVNALVVDSNNNMYAGGNFSAVCGDPTCNPATNTAMNHIATWNGSAWVSIGNGLNNDVFALAVDGSNNVYAGGVFREVCGNAACNNGNVQVNHIAKWNPSGGGSWSGLLNGLNADVYALAVDSTNTVYIGGGFTNMCSDATWCSLGPQLNHIAKWYPTPGNYGDLLNGLNGRVDALAVDGSDNVYAGGRFQFLCGNYDCTGNGPRVNYIARWNPSGVGNWSALGNGVNSWVIALAMDLTSNTLYAGGIFTNLCGDSACGTAGLQVNYIAKWNSAGSSSWSALGNGMPEERVRALRFRAGNLYAGGNFKIAGEVGASRVAKYSGGNWSALGSGAGLDGTGVLLVDSIAIDAQENVYVGGKFNIAGGVVANNIAKWNGSTWMSLGYGVHGEIDALAIDSAGSLYAGGSFDFICADLMCASPGPRANNIAQWNGSSWSGLGYGLNRFVRALAIDKNGHLYVGGAFSNTCANSDCSSLALQVNVIAQWDGNGWSPVGAGFNEAIYALAVDSNNHVYAGGVFDHLCGDVTCGSLAAPMNRVAKWNPAGSGTWSPLGYGVNQFFVLALAVDTHNNIYVAGDFQFLCADAACTSNGARVNHIAKWNPTGSGTWAALGNGLGSAAYALALDSADNLFVGGAFTKVCGEAACSGSGTPAGYIAKWSPTGSSGWSGLGSGTNQVVNAIAARNGRVYAEGQFDRAGGKVSFHFGRYTDNYAPTVSNGAAAGKMNKPLMFRAASFPLSDAEGDPLTKVRITSLPAHGTLEWNEAAVVVNQEIAVADLGQLAFVPAAGWAGTTSMSWNGFDGISYAVSGASVNMTIGGSDLYLPLLRR